MMIAALMGSTSRLAVIPAIQNQPMPDLRTFDDRFEDELWLGAMKLRRPFSFYPAGSD